MELPVPDPVTIDGKTYDYYAMTQKAHIKERHPGDYETVLEHMAEAIRKPDFILKDERKNTGLIIKAVKEENIQTVLRIHTSEDEEGYKNSIISCWGISKKRLQNYLRNKEILYKKE